MILCAKGKINSKSVLIKDIDSAKQKNLGFFAQCLAATVRKKLCFETFYIPIFGIKLMKSWEAQRNAQHQISVSIYFFDSSFNFFGTDVLK